jgi:hypothetical protein
MWCSAVFEVTSTANGLVCHVHTKENNNLTSVGEPHGDLSSAVAELESLVRKALFLGSRFTLFVDFSSKRVLSGFISTFQLNLTPFSPQVKKTFLVYLCQQAKEEQILIVQVGRARRLLPLLF